MSEKRQFELVSKYQHATQLLPYRATKQAAGYDLMSAQDIVILSNYGPVLVSTGVKVKLPANEFLMVVNRSSNPLKRQLILANGVGIIDADYYNNVENEGEIFVQLQNMGDEDYRIQKGDRIAQGIFMPFLTTGFADDQTKQRTGGLGSTGQR